jgi:hypothetical protein
VGDLVADCGGGFDAEHGCAPGCISVIRLVNNIVAPHAGVTDHDLSNILVTPYLLVIIIYFTMLQCYHIKTRDGSG